MSNRRDFTKKDPVFTGTEGAVVPGGSTANRAGAPVQGTVRYNTDLGLAEFYTSTGWAAVAPPPSVSSITGTLTESTDVNLTILGSGFDAGATVSIVGAAVSGVERSLTTTFVNSGELTAASNGAAVNYVGGASFDVKVTNTTGLSATLTPAGTIDRLATWNTASGSRGSFGDRAGSISVTHTATDPDGQTVTYSQPSGSIPPGTSLNTSNGTISGDPNDVSGTTNYSYTLRATSNGIAQDRSFSITITQTADGSVSGRAFTELSDLANVYSSDQSNLWWTWKGAFSPTQIPSATQVDFSTPSNPRFQTSANNGSTGGYNNIFGSCIDTGGGVGGCTQGTSSDYNWYNAILYCMRAGYRLCTDDEIANNVATGSGCSHDSRAIWTSTNCGGNNYRRRQGNNGGGTECVAATNTSPSGYTINEIGIRCCTVNSGVSLWSV